jgi:hypothetical protein
MSQVAKSLSALDRAFLAILVLELEAMVIRLFRQFKLAGVYGDRRTVRLGIQAEFMEKLNSRNSLEVTAIKPSATRLAV